MLAAESLMCQRVHAPLRYRERGSHLLAESWMLLILPRFDGGGKCGIDYPNQRKAIYVSCNNRSHGSSERRFYEKRSIPTMRITNTLTGEKEAFVPASLPV